MRKNDDMVSLDELKARLRRFCEKHRIQRLDVFGSAARGEAGPGSDVDLLVTLDESSPVSVAELLEMAGEAEEVVGPPGGFRPASFSREIAEPFRTRAYSLHCGLRLWRLINLAGCAIFWKRRASLRRI